MKRSKAQPKAKKDSIDHDGLYKAVINEFFMDFLSLFYPDLAEQIDPASVKERGQEVIVDLLSGKKLRVDLLREVQFKGKSQLVLILVEPQSYYDSGFEERLFLYFIGLYFKYRLPVLPIAVLSSPEANRDTVHVYHLRLDEETELSFKHRAIQLNRMHWQEYADRGNAVASAFMAQMQVGDKQKVQAKLASLTQIVELPLNEAQRHLLSGFVDTYLRLDTPQQTEFEQELGKLGQGQKEKTMQIVTSWMEQGIEQGEKKGKLELIQKLVARRFGPLSTEEESRLKEMNSPQLETLAEDFLDFKERTDLTAWFEAHSATPTAG